MINIMKSYRMDFYLLKNYLFNLLYVCVVAIVIGFFTSFEAMAMIIITFSAYFLNTLFVVEEKFNISTLQSILPVSKRDIVIGRYLLSYTVLLLLSFIAIALYLIHTFLFQDDTVYTNGFLIIITSIILASLFISIQYPFYFKFEHSKASIVSILPYVFVFAIGIPAMQRVFRNPDQYNHFINLITIFQTHVVVTFIIGIIGSLLLFLISCLLSLKLYQIQK